MTSIRSRWQIPLLYLIYLSSGLSGCGGGAGGGAPAMSLSFADEFDGAAGTRPDVTRWVNDVGGNGWGNNELQYYTNSTRNAALDGAGHLALTAIAESMGGRAYTSARIKTQGLFEQAFGRFEARLQLPSGRGLWPAFWLLGNNVITSGWPACGEIDVMEAIGSQPSVNRGSLHGPGYSGGAALTSRYTLPAGAGFDRDFHTFAIDWDSAGVRFSVDDQIYATRTVVDLPPSGLWAFDHPFFLILDVAVGGNLPGSPDTTTVFPQQMLVDYVRVYR
ncbi:MAG TPA: glycoside hydrolase family 16 protein [Polyangia bacterium]|nr:glycoside hydrolase family 16 protein [Polyangia bacterium]